MNKLLYILLFMLVAGTVSCHRTSEAEARLIAIDSLIPDAPDSALALLEAIDTASLRGEMRAYHALLTAQALYKAYIPATSDSIINRAWDYYKGHGSYDRRIRAMLYKGTTAEELGHPEEAMRWYKRTELESRPDDHYHRGYAFEKMALIYQGVYEPKPAISKFRLALPEFETIIDTSNILFCDLSLSKMYPEFNMDSALYYGNKLVNHAVEFNMIEYVAYYTGIMGRYLFYDGKYEQAKDSLLLLTNCNNDLPNTTYLLLALSFAQLNNMDSALYFIKKADKPFNVNDSILYYQFMSIQCKNSNDIEGSIKNEQLSNDLAAMVIVNSKDNSFQQVEFEETEIFQKTKNKKRHIIIAILLSLSLFGFIIYYFMNLRRRERYVHEIEELQAFSNKLQNLNNDLKFKYDIISNQKTVQSATDKHTLLPTSLSVHVNTRRFDDIISGLSESFRFIITQIRKNTQTEKELNKLDNIILKTLTPGYFEHLREFVDYAYSGLFSSMKESSLLDDKEINVICMYLCRLPNTIIRIYTGLSNTQNAIRYRNRIANKYFGSKEELDSLLNNIQF